jgi:hypothetical protein
VLFARRDRATAPAAEDELIAFDFEDLLTLRTARHAIDVDRFGKLLTRSDFKEMVKTYARALQYYAADILQGDFTMSPEHEKIFGSECRITPAIK